jgi:hypothetical protein
MKPIIVAVLMWATSAPIGQEAFLHEETCCFKAVQGSSHCLPCDVYYWLTSCSEIEL